jgi:hypothetical protein
MMQKLLRMLQDIEWHGGARAPELGQFSYRTMSQHVYGISAKKKRKVLRHDNHHLSSESQPLCTRMA